MPSDETLRFTLVCKLPLLHFSHSRVAVHNAQVTKELPFPVAATVEYLAISFRPAFTPAPSSSAPAFRLHVRSRGCLTRSELPLRTHSSRSFFRGFLRPRLPFWTSSGLWAILWSDSNPLSLLRRLSSHVRHPQTPQPRATYDSHSRILSVATLIEFLFRRHRFRGRHVAAPVFEFMVRGVTLSSLPQTV